MKIADNVVDRCIARNDQRRLGLNEIIDDPIPYMPAGNIEREAIGGGPVEIVEAADG